jgi:hypothetical protein
MLADLAQTTPVLFQWQGTEQNASTSRHHQADTARFPLNCPIYPKLSHLLRSLLHGSPITTSNWAMIPMNLSALIRLLHPPHHLRLFALQQRLVRSVCSHSVLRQLRALLFQMPMGIVRRSSQVVRYLSKIPLPSRRTPSLFRRQKGRARVTACKPVFPPSKNPERRIPQPPKLLKQLSRPKPRSLLQVILKIPLQRMQLRHPQTPNPTLTRRNLRHYLHVHLKTL